MFLSNKAESHVARECADSWFIATGCGDRSSFLPIWFANCPSSNAQSYAGSAGVVNVKLLGCAHRCCDEREVEVTLYPSDDVYPIR